MFFINNDKTEVGQRGKQGAPRANDNIAVSFHYPLPFVELLSRRKTAMHYCHTSREATSKSLYRLLGQSDFRYKADASLASGNNLGQSSQVDLSLAAACNAKKEKNRRTAGWSTFPHHDVMNQLPGSLLR